MYYRKLYKYLLSWKDDISRKPLIIRGARQVGKTTLVNEFGKVYKYFISLNLDRTQDRGIFEKNDSARDIIETVFLREHTPFTTVPVLLFIDEIQESPSAIKMLRYLHEEYPGIHIIAAGSLLEFALKDVVSFPVGRVDQIVLHPFDFEEFLLAAGREDLLSELESLPVKGYAHDVLLEQFHDYAVIGGMPEVIKKYIEEKTVINLGAIYSNLWQSYRDDVEKYASNSTERKIIRHIIDTAPFETGRITLAGFGNSAYRSREAGEAIRALDMARIIQLIYPVTGTHPPVVPDIKRKPRLQFLDTGLLNFAAGIQYEMIGLKDMNSLVRGDIIQHLVTQQLQSQYHSPLYKPAFWVREKANSNAEVDLVFQHSRYIIPIEVKSGAKGRLRSLHQFVDISGNKYAVRLLANKPLIEKSKTPGGTPYLLLNMPYYASTKLPEYIRWFIENN